MDSKKQAQGIASLGRYGDTTLMHMRPDEVEQLKAISRAGGGDITINPKTGMPEAFLGDFFSALAPTAAGIVAGSVFPPAYAPYLAAGAGGLTAYAQGKRDPLGIAMGALGGYGGGNIGQGLVAQGTPAVPAGSAESSFMPTDTTIGGANLTSAAPSAATGTTGEIGSSMLTTQGGRGITAVGPTQVYKPINTGLGPNMNQVNNPFATPRPEGFDYSLDKNFSNKLPDIQPDSTPANIPKLQSKTPLEQGFEYSKSQLGKLGSGIKNVATDSESRSKFFSDLGGGSETAGMFKTALPVAGAGAEAYMKGYYDNMPTYEASTAGKYDPTRVLDLGMDTGLRLLAKGGHVKNYVMGGMTQSDPGGYSSSDLSKMAAYGVVPQYQTQHPMGIMGAGKPTRMPVQGFVDVGGKFVADPKGDITDVAYIDKYKYILEGPEKQDQDSSGDMDTINAAAQSGTGINPAVALNLAEGYADTQQSDTAETGLGGLKKGGTINYQQGGATTAETNTAKAATPPPATTMDMLIAKKNEEEMAKQGIPAGINIEAIKKQAGMADGGLAGLTPDDGKMLNGNGDGVSDDIPAMIEGEQEAALSDGEFIVPARIVSELGNGSSDAGAQKLYSMIDRIQAARKQTIGDDKQYAKDTNAERFLPV